MNLPDLNFIRFFFKSCTRLGKDENFEIRLYKCSICLRFEENISFKRISRYNQCTFCSSSYRIQADPRDKLLLMEPWFDMIAPRYLKFFTSSSIWLFILISHWNPFGLFVITFVLSGPISILYLVVVLSRRFTLLLPLLHLRQCHLQRGSW